MSENYIVTLLRNTIEMSYVFHVFIRIHANFSRLRTEAVSGPSANIEASHGDFSCATTQRRCNFTKLTERRNFNVRWLP